MSKNRGHSWEVVETGVWLNTWETTTYSETSSSTMRASIHLTGEELIDHACMALSLAGLFNAPTKRAKSQLLAAATKAGRGVLEGLIAELKLVADESENDQPESEIAKD